MEASKAMGTAKLWRQGVPDAMHNKAMRSEPVGGSEARATKRTGEAGGPWGELRHMSDRHPDIRGDTV